MTSRQSTGSISSLPLIISSRPLNGYEENGVKFISFPIWIAGCTLLRTPEFGLPYSRILQGSRFLTVSSRWQETDVWDLVKPRGVYAMGGSGRATAVGGVSLASSASISASIRGVPRKYSYKLKESMLSKATISLKSQIDNERLVFMAVCLPYNPPSIAIQHNSIIHSTPRINQSATGT